MPSPSITTVLAAAVEATGKAAGAATKTAVKKPPKHYYYTSRWFWASSCAVVAALMLLNIYKRTRAWYIISQQKASSENPAAQPSWRNTVQATRIPSAVHAQWINIAAYKTSICPDWLYVMPNINELLFLAVYAACSIVFAIHGTWSEKMKKYDAANQMGHIAFAQITFIIGLAGKNNVISWLTGISYTKLNVLHRASGRLCWIFSVVHSIGRIQKGMSSGKHSIYVSDMQWGVVALIFYTFLTFGSLRFMRNVAYEAFLIGHIVMVAGYLIAAWLHWPPFSYWIYPGIVLWGLDRLVRFVNVIILNKLWLIPMGKEKRAAMGQCDVELVSPEVLRVSVKREHLKWSAGQHAYLVMPTVSTFPLEAHPFSIASAPSADGPSEAVFIIKVHDGGTGITYALGHFLQVVNRARQSSSVVKHLHLVWNIRHAEHLNWILPLLRPAIDNPVNGLKVEISIYTTLSASPSVTSLSHVNEKTSASSSSETGSSSASTAEKGDLPSDANEKNESGAGSAIRWYSGRANLNRVLSESVKQCAGSVAVNVCGPRSLSASTRAAVREVNKPGMVLRGQGELVLYEETFGW